MKIGKKSKLRQRGTDSDTVDRVKIRKKAKLRETGSDTVDRVSKLPDFILHAILLNLDTKEACRASVLSKRWYEAWSSIPVLDFQILCFKESRHFSREYDDGFCDDGFCGPFPEFREGFYDADTVRRFVGYVDKTMRRYLERKFRITKLKLVLHEVDEKLKPFVDQWIKTAVQNQIEELDFEVRLCNLPNYKLPEILFSAKSLKVLRCNSVELPYYQSMKLVSLEYLTIRSGIVDENMFQRIISLCPLVNIRLGLQPPKTNSLSEMRKANEGAEYFGSGTMQSNLKVIPLTKLVYVTYGCDLLWPCNMYVGSLRNLKILKIHGSTITDDVVSQLAHGLVASESLVLSRCPMLKCVKISSISLKKLKIKEMWTFIDVTVDAPNLLEFWYYCMKGSLSLIRAQEHCNVYLSLLDEPSDAVWFLKLNKFLIDTSIFTSLILDFQCAYQILDAANVLRNAVFIGPPYKLRELKLRNISLWKKFSNSYFEIILDVLFRICHPDVLSITTIFKNWTPMVIVDIMKEKVKCWNHPLKSIEIEADYSSLLSESAELEIRFKLSW